MKTDTLQAERRGLKLVAAGMLFLFNPVIGTADILPDFIGYLMIVYGMSHIADLEERFYKSRRGFISLAIVGLIKTASCLLLQYMNETLVLTLALAFSVTEAIFFIPAVVNLFDGFSYFGVREGIESVYRVPTLKALRGKEGAKYGSVSSLRVYTIIAFIVRAAGAVIPLLPVLKSYNYSGLVTNAPVYEHREIIYCAASAAAVLAVCLPWALKMMRWLTGIRRDEAFVGGLAARYEKTILPDRELFAQKQMRAVTVWMILGALGCFNIYMDYVNFVPNIIAAICFAAVMILLRRGCRYTVPGLVSCTLWAAVSVLVTLAQRDYIKNNYRPSSFGAGIGRSEELYPHIMALDVADAVLMTVTVIFLMLCVANMLKEHCGIYENGQAFRAGRGEALYRSLRRSVLPVPVMLFVIALTVGVYPFACVYYPEVWLIFCIAEAALVLLLLRAAGKVKNDLYDHFGEGLKSKTEDD